MPDGGDETTVWISSLYWTIKDVRKAPLLWVAPLGGIKLDGIGNLLLSAPMSGSWGNYALKGASYHYYLLDIGEKRGEPVLAIDTCGAAPDHQILYREIGALGLSFGQSIGTRQFYGVDMDGVTVGHAGGHYGSIGPRDLTAEPLVPQMDLEAWVVPFFEAVTAYEKNPFYPEDHGNFQLCTWYYVDSVSDYSVEGRQLKLLAALGAAAAHLCRENPGTAAEPEAWRAWVETHATEIRGRARPGQEDLLLDLVGRAIAPTNIDLIRLAARAASISLTQEMQDALAQAQRGLVGTSGPLGAANATIPHLRSLLAAFVARITNYKGPLVGWERMGNYCFAPAPEDWWKPQMSAAEIPYYHAKIDEDPAGMKDLWPHFERPTVPRDGLLAKVSVFAETLVANTGGAVGAIVRPVPREDGDEEELFSFVLRLVQHPGVQSVLFTMSTKQGAIVVSGWGEPEIIQTETQLTSFLRRMAASKETRTRIQRLLLAAESAVDE